MLTLQLIGGGRMGQALLQGLIDADWAPPAELAVVEVAEDQRALLTDRFAGVDIRATPVAEVDTLVAVKPHLVVEVCRGLVRPGRVLSVAAGITIAAMEEALPAGTPVVRAMPNTPALVGTGAAGLAGGGSADADDVAWAAGILGSVGVAEQVPEPLLDAVTGLSGSGPAYVFLMAEALTDAGVAMGLTRDVAGRLARQTIAGAGRMLGADGADPVDLRAGVTTPAGTTAAGLAALEERGLRAALAAAVRAATERSIELGRG
jgi:pyrroline-5-carboxylate reductase